jgi:DNA repair photolyase
MLQISQTAPRTQLITKSTFKAYDACFNPYVGCQFGCKYCYVRFFVKDDGKDREFVPLPTDLLERRRITDNLKDQEGYVSHQSHTDGAMVIYKRERDKVEWGEFVRRREHIADKLPREVARGHIRIDNGSIKHEDGTKQRLHKTIENKDIRLVIGTMTDPYMPIERKYRLTRTALEILKDAGYNKIGVFTRSPIVLDDLDLIKQLPRARVHFSITPYKPEILKKIEPIAIPTEARFDTIQKIKEAGIRVHVNVAPAIPIYSEGFEDEFCKRLADIGVDEFFVDPMQAYDQSFTATEETLQNDPDWPKTRTIMQVTDNYNTWKDAFRKAWEKAWKKHGREETLAIWCDHINHTWDNLRTGEKLDPRNYND